MAEHDFPTEDLVRYVNLLQGTDSHFRFSRGNCLPLVARPFGMTHWSPQTDDDRWLFRPNAHQLQGIRATHQPSPWIGDYGYFTVMAQVGRRLLRASHRSSAYRPDELTLQPHYLSILLRRYSTRMEMTPTERCSVFRFTFPDDEVFGKSEAQGKVNRIILEPGTGESAIKIHPDSRRITGWTRSNSGGVPENFACHFAIVFDRPFHEAALTKDGQALHGESGSPQARLGVIAEFPPGEAPLEMQIGTSFISADQATLNLEREVGSRSFDGIRSDGEAVWNQALARISVAGGADEQLRTFYSCLYRAHLFPRMWYEFDASGRPIHFSPYDGAVHDGVLYSDNGFWDTYRTVYPLLSLILPDRLGEIVEGWVQAYREGGWFPQWASPGYRACMVGTHIDAVIADACVKYIQGFDRETAYAGMLKHANFPGDDDGSYGRLGIQDYLERGYVPAERVGGSVARSLDYAYDDFCISQVADVLGRHEERDQYRQRSLNYRHLYDPAVGFMRAKNADGAWVEPFEEFTWGGPYVEGGPWQSTWAVPHDPTGLIRLMGGPESFTRKLEELLHLEPRFDVGSYGFEIHEMTEMAAVPFGQYAHSNQPVHHVLHLFTAAGHPARAHFWIRRVMAELYSPEGFAGDEDNGEMSSWYLLNALGLFPLCPGHPGYVLGSPIFSAVRLQLPGNKELVIHAQAAAPQNVYVHQVTWNGVPHGKLWISHQDLVSGGQLQFAMSNQPPDAFRVSDPDALPFSISDARR